MLVTGIMILLQNVNGTISDIKQLMVALMTPLCWCDGNFTDFTDITDLSC